MLENKLVKGLRLTIDQKDDRIIKVIKSTFDDIMSYCIGKHLTTDLVERIRIDFTNTVVHKLNSYDMELPIHLTMYVDGTTLHIIPANLFTAAFIDGYNIDPILLKDIDILEINGKKYEVDSYRKLLS